MSLHNQGFRNLMWLWLSVSIIALDQWSKGWVIKTLILAQPRQFIPHVNLLLKYNTGAAFSFLAQADGWQRWLFSGIAIVVSVLITIWLYRLPRRHTGTAIALTLILGGALGNLWDRITWGYVIDFIDFYVGNWHFATFNVADSAISIGALILAMSLLRIKKVDSETN